MSQNFGPGHGSKAVSCSQSSIHPASLKTVLGNISHKVEFFRKNKNDFFVACLWSQPTVPTREKKYNAASLQ